MVGERSRTSENDYQIPSHYTTYEETEEIGIEVI